ncbi:uncharacterized protein LOC121833171 [Ixodes scapularis]|uniref:uncharacterized protein LOC121833171 n=1 Tax=Ixodes scapularis TaxID=6945 RepID=UPI001C38AF79|nr:uncharacterized protein LOC121833171 [Ixodes scapularis]
MTVGVAVMLCVSRRIDLVVAHSSAIYPSLNVMTRPGMPAVGGLALLAPAGHQLVRAIRPLPLMRAFAVHYTNPRYQGFMRRLGIAIMKCTRNPIKPNMEDAIMSLQTMIFSDYDQAGHKIKQVAESGTPLLIAFSENDRAINPEVIFNMVDLIGTRNEDLWLYDADGKLAREGEQTAYAVLGTKGSPSALASPVQRADVTYFMLGAQDACTLLKLPKLAWEPCHSAEINDYSTVAVSSRVDLEWANWQIAV